MNTRVLLNLSLLALLVLLALLAWFRPGQTPPAPPATLALFEAANVSRITVERAGRDAIAFEKAEGQWRMTAPLQTGADTFAIDSLLAIATTTGHAQFNAGDVDLRNFMLDAPPVTVRFDDRVVHFGDVEPLSGRRYVLTAGVVYLIDDHLFQRLTGEPVGLVSRSLLPPAAVIEAIALPAQRIARDDSGEWTVTPPAENVSQDDVVALIDEWRHAQAIRVSLVDASPSEGTVEVQLAGSPAPWRFELQRVAHDRFLVRRDLGLRYQFTEHQFERLTTPAARASGGE